MCLARPALLVFLSIWLVSVATRAQQQAPQRDAQAVALLAQCSAAMGTIGPTTTVYAGGQLTSTTVGNAPGRIVLKSMGPERFRREVTNPEAEYTSVVNNGVGHSLSNGQRRRLPSWHTKYSRPEHIPAALCSMDLVRPRMRVVYLGLEDLSGVTAHHIQFFVLASDTTRGSDRFEPLISDFHLFLDSQSFVVLKTRTYVFSPDAIENRSSWESYYSDYRTISGVLMPFHMVNYIAGQKAWDIVFSSIQMNVPIAATEFE